jgi:homoserine O-acetyltransferase/O-succinyltransferase
MSTSGWRSRRSATPTTSCTSGIRRDDFDPSADLEKITAPVLVINSADDERNPPELGVLEAAAPRIPTMQTLIIPGSPETTGHGTTGGKASLYAARLADFLASVPAQTD